MIESKGDKTKVKIRIILKRKIINFKIQRKNKSKIKIQKIKM
jgi:hypothetical protein